MFSELLFFGLGVKLKTELCIIHIKMIRYIYIYILKTGSLDNAIQDALLA